MLPLSHDEVVHGKGSLLRKMPGDRWQQLANLRAYFAFMWAHPGKQLLFMGCEFAPGGRVGRGPRARLVAARPPGHRGVQPLVRDLNARLPRRPRPCGRATTTPTASSWIDANDATGNVFSFVRSDGDGLLVACVANFAAVPHDDYRVGLPAAGAWREVLNTDAEVYAGSGVGNLGRGRPPSDEPSHGLPASAVDHGPAAGRGLAAARAGRTCSHR